MKHADEVFRELMRTSTYGDTAPAETKLAILRSVWKEAAPDLAHQFDEHSLADGGESQGFGYLVEAFARRSLLLPRNTEAGDTLARQLLTALHMGDSVVGTGYRLSNPDILWVENTGRQATITGFGEIKSSAEALIHRPEQLANFEPSLRLLMKKIAKDKEQRNATDYLRIKKVSLAEPLRKVLILPAGEKGKVKWSPAGWEACEIEFSYNELVFVGQQIWPEFRPAFKTTDGYLLQYEREFLARLDLWAALRFNRIFAKSAVKPFPVREYLLFNFATNKLAVADTEVTLTRECVANASFETSFPPERVSESQLTIWEKKFLNQFVLEWEADAGVKAYALHFLHDLRAFSRSLAKVLKTRNLNTWVKEAHAFDLLDT